MKQRAPALLQELLAAGAEELRFGDGLPPGLRGTPVLPEDDAFTLLACRRTTFEWALRRHVVRPLQTLANMLEALREGDYSMRGRNVDPEDAFGEVMVEVNTLSRTLYDQRLEALEAGALLQKIIADVDIAVFAFDAALRLRLVNKAGENLLGDTIEALQGRSAAELGLAGMLAEESGRIVRSWCVSRTLQGTVKAPNPRIPPAPGCASAAAACAPPWLRSGGCARA